MSAKKPEPFIARIKAKHSKLFLDVEGQRRDNGAKVVQWQDNPGAQQRWLISPVNDDPGYYYIIAMHSGLFLDVLNAERGRRAQVGTWELDHGDQQKWELEPAGDGCHRLRAKHSRLYLDVLGAAGHNGSAIGQWDSDPGDQQRWHIELEGRFLPDMPAPEVFPSTRPHLEGPYQPKPEGPWYRVYQEYLPFYMVKDYLYNGFWKIEHSPYYILEARQRHISKKDWFLDNQTSEVTQLEFTNTSGWSETESTEFSSTTGITMSAGGSIGPVDLSVEISQEFTHTTGSESSRYGEQSNTVSIPVGAGKAVAAWAVETEFVLRRKDNSIVDRWSLHGGYLIDEFPDQVTATIPARLVPFLSKLEEALEHLSAGAIEPEQAMAIAALAQAAVAVIEAESPE